MAIKTFDPKGVHLVYGGALITGYAEGSMIRVEYNEDRYNLTVGNDGLAMRNKTNNESGRITVSLMPNSPGNAIFQGAQDLDKRANAGALPLVLTDTSTGDKWTGEGAWIMKDPGRDMQKTIQAVEWVLECDSLVSLRRPQV